MSTGRQTILGAGGVIGKGLARELSSYAKHVRLVGRNPTNVNPDDELVVADLLDSAAVQEAVRESDIAYLVAGLEYKATVWREQWPTIMGNVIEACRRHDVRLVFFDNVYLYGRVNGPMTEETSVNPSCAKGEVRAQIAEMLMNEIVAGNVKALVARAADFYGPEAVTTFVHPMVFEKLRAGKKAAWLCNDDVPHSMTFTPDAVRGTALLGNTDEAYGQVWHLPTHGDAPTGKKFVEMVAATLNASPRYRVLKPGMLTLVGFFNPLVRESIELLYQNQYPYIVDSTKFNQCFFQPTPYREGIQQTVEWLGR